MKIHVGTSINPIGLWSARPSELICTSRYYKQPARFEIGLLFTQAAEQLEYDNAAFGLLSHRELSHPWRRLDRRFLHQCRQNVPGFPKTCRDGKKKRTGGPNG